jgi:hypothetical protein
MAQPTQPIVDWSTQENDSEGKPLKIMPPLELQATGLLKKQPFGRQWMNYVLNNHSEWIKYAVSRADYSEGIVGELRSFSTQQPQLLTKGWQLVQTVTGTAQTTTTNLYTYEYVG